MEVQRGYHVCRARASRGRAGEPVRIRSAERRLCLCFRLQRGGRALPAGAAASRQHLLARCAGERQRSLTPWCRRSEVEIAVSEACDTQHLIGRHLADHHRAQILVLPDAETQLAAFDELEALRLARPRQIDGEEPVLRIAVAQLDRAMLRIVAIKE